MKGHDRPFHFIEIGIVVDAWFNKMSDDNQYDQKNPVVVKQIFTFILGPFLAAEYSLDHAELLHKKDRKNNNTAFMGMSS